jgi:hypothetical protein
MTFDGRECAVATCGDVTRNGVFAKPFQAVVVRSQEAFR